MNRSLRARAPRDSGYARRMFRHMLVFVLILLLLRRFTGVQVSILGSIVLTLVVSLIMAQLGRRGD